MPLPLKEARAAAEIGRILSGLLPGSGSPQWKGHVSFHTITREIGLGEFWGPGSKESAVTTLLERTLEFRRHLFERLILDVVRAGTKYREKQRAPVTRDEVERLNMAILKVGFKFPDLWDPAFLDSLPEASGSAPAARPVPDKDATDQRARESAERIIKLDRLRTEFYRLATMQDRQAAGLAFERVLHDLFSLYGLAPRKPFRVEGEQIDGSFTLDGEVYLLEAKWEAAPLPEAPLLVFREKIAAKSNMTRGAYIAPNGITETARTALARGKQPNFFLVVAYDLVAVLEGQIPLNDLLRRKMRRLAEEGEVFVSVSELLS